MKYKKVLIKLSGESLSGNSTHIIDPLRLKKYASEIQSIYNLECKISIVIGGGNIVRGIDYRNYSIDRVQADYMGMLSTVINGIAFQSALEELGISTRLQTSISINKIAEPFIRKKAKKHLNNHRIVIFVAGTGNPYFTTDTAAVLRAIEMDSDILLKATRVDGVYSSDPEKNSNAVKYDRMTYEQIYNNNIKVMDMTAITLSKDNNLPIIVFNINKTDNLKNIILGNKVGTIITN